VKWIDDNATMIILPLIALLIMHSLFWNSHIYNPSTSGTNDRDGRIRRQDGYCRISNFTEYISVCLGSSICTFFCYFYSISNL